MAHGQIGTAARKGDYDEVLRLALVKVCDLLDATDSGRDGSALFIKIIDGVEKIEARRGAHAEVQDGHTEVPRFEVIAGKRSERRAAAQG